jgi:hypothetical protein
MTAEAHAKARIEHSAAPGAPWVNFCLTSEARLQAFQQGFLFPKKHPVFFAWPCVTLQKLDLQHMKLSRKLT